MAAAVPSVPEAPPPRHPVAHGRPDTGGSRAFRHRPGSAPERADAAVEQAPDQVPDQAPGQAPDQVPGQAPEADRSDADRGSPEAGPTEDTSGESVTTASGQTVAAAAAPIVLPAHWRDASTVQLPLGAGLSLIGCGLGLVGLRLRRG